ncbi:DUF1244 domain-containing protein [Nitrincola tibetensis]|uniref:DUF1244 domain-containing protein n=1 Tax=Nitrincola tibetensis TaxID=2219697 RepID=A0A364NNC5_9GAMM|nr:DUF1244 domain-containing protein [Nitrincola tibetensis]RAU18573.1 DUF1244 domain-containing protein [Nitrincola tibetensis]
MKTLDQTTQTELEAAAFRTLIQHLDVNKDVQNIDLMILADFCRNCLAKWLVSAAEAKGIQLGYEEAREHVYGMPYSQWKDLYQAPATPEQLAAFAQREAAKKGAKE